MLSKGLNLILIFIIIVPLLTGCEKAKTILMPVEVRVQMKREKSLLQDLYYITGIATALLSVAETYSETAQTTIWGKMRNPWYCVPAAVATGAVIGLNYKYNCANDDDEDTVKTKSKVKPSPTPSFKTTAN